METNDNLITCRFSPSARGYFLASSQDPENLVRAEAALDEVIATMDTSVESVRDPFPATLYP